MRRALAAANIVATTIEIGRMVCDRAPLDWLDELCPLEPLVAVVLFG